MNACPECHCGECGHVAPKLLDEPCGNCGHVGHRYMHSAYDDDIGWPVAAPVEEVTHCQHAYFGIGATVMSEETQSFYTCENCGIRGPLSIFDGECKPGWIHGRLIKDGEPKPPDYEGAWKEWRRWGNQLIAEGRQK